MPFARPLPPWGSRETHKDAVKQLFLSLARLKSDLDRLDLPFKSLQTPCLYFSTCIISYSGSYLTFKSLQPLYLVADTLAAISLNAHDTDDLVDNDVDSCYRGGQWGTPPPHLNGHALPGEDKAQQG